MIQDQKKRKNIYEDDMWHTTSRVVSALRFTGGGLDMDDNWLYTINAFDKYY
jgi:hypothetical protein